MASNTLRRRSTYRALNGHKKDRPRPFLRIALVLLVTFMMLTSGASAATLFFYGTTLPSLGNFKHRFEFQNTRILDDRGHVMYNLADLSKSRGQRMVEPLVATGQTTQWYADHSEPWLVGRNGYGIPVSLQNATIAAEDASFYSNLGFDPLSIARAEYDNLTKGYIVSGASTITQQLIREYLLTPSVKFSRKIEEVILAAELTQKYPKSKILWYYLNSIPYGNLSRGAQAAAKTYFHRNVWRLDPAQSAFLAGLPEAPSTYDPVNNLPGALGRMRYVLHLMYIHGYLVDNQGHRDSGLINTYMNEAKHWPKFQPPKTQTEFPQFVQYAIGQLQNLPGLSNKIYDGLDVYTGLDPTLQIQAQHIVEGQVSQLGAYNVSDGALVSLDLRPGCYGCIMAMVGSAGYNTVPGGKINMADRPRQPGSSFKPFNYIYAFEHGLGPASTVTDGPIAIADTGNAADGGVYAPTDYDHQWHGLVDLRTALQNSLNVPAVKVEQYDTTQTSGGTVYSTVRAEAIKLGISSFDADNPQCCGWSLTLGGMQQGVRLVEETGAYGAFATGGHKVAPVAIRKVVDRTTGKVLYDATGMMHSELSHSVIPAADAYVMNNVLSDNATRCAVVCEFGLDSPLYLGRPAGAKTGTTNNFTDNWTVGYTPDIVTGVWVGNANDAPMVGTTGVTGAAPIWHDFMLSAFSTLHEPPINFVQPPGVYFGSTCRSPTGYGGTVLSSFAYDVYATIIPYCSVDSILGGASAAPQAPSSTGPVSAIPTPTTAVAAPTQPVVQIPATKPPVATVAPTPPQAVSTQPVVAPTAVAPAPVPTTAPAAPITQVTP